MFFILFPLYYFQNISKPTYINELHNTCEKKRYEVIIKAELKFDNY